MKNLKSSQIYIMNFIFLNLFIILNIFILRQLAKKTFLY